MSRARTAILQGPALTVAAMTALMAVAFAASGKDLLAGQGTPFSRPPLEKGEGEHGLKRDIGNCARVAAPADAAGCED